MYPFQFPLTQSSVQNPLHYVKPNTNSYVSAEKQIPVAPLSTSEHWTQYTNSHSSEKKQLPVAPLRISEHWTRYQDELLLNGIKKFGPDWANISQCYFTTPKGEVTRKAKSCLKRYKDYWYPLYKLEVIQEMKAPIQVIETAPRKREINDYPANLSENSHPVSTDSSIGDDEKGRSKKRIKPSYLKIKRDTFLQWTIEEDQRLLKAIHQFGNNWQRIAIKEFSSENHCTRKSDACYSRYRYYWQKLYSISEIQKMKEPFEIKFYEGKRVLVQSIQNVAKNVGITTTETAVPAELGTEPCVLVELGMKPSVAAESRTESFVTTELETAKTSDEIPLSTESENSIFEQLARDLGIPSFESSIGNGGHSDDPLYSFYNF